MQSCVTVCAVVPSFCYHIFNLHRSSSKWVFVKLLFNVENVVLVQRVDCFCLTYRHTSQHHSVTVELTHCLPEIFVPKNNYTDGTSVVLADLLFLWRDIWIHAKSAPISVQLNSNLPLAEKTDKQAYNAHTESDRWGGGYTYLFWGRLVCVYCWPLTASQSANHTQHLL